MIAPETPGGTPPGTPPGIDPETAARIKEKRIAGMLERYMQGRDLTPEQWREVIAAHPQLASIAPPSIAGNAAAIAAAHANAQAQAAPAGSIACKLFALNPEHENRKERLERWSTLYGSDARTVQRWISKGKAAQDPPPLDDPAAMPSWWVRHMTHSVPVKVLAAAKAARDDTPEAAPATAVATAGPRIAPAAVEAALAQVRLADFELEEGEAVAKQRKLVAALFDKLEREYDRNGDNVDHLQAQYLKAAENLRKLEASERKSELERGKYVLKAVIDRDIAAAAEMLRQLHETRERRVLELCPNLAQEHRAEVAQALATFSQHEQRIFRSLKSLRSPSDVLALADS